MGGFELAVQKMKENQMEKSEVEIELSGLLAKTLLLEDELNSLFQMDD